MKPDRNSSPDTFGPTTSVERNCTPGNCWVSLALMPFTAAVGSDPVSGWNFRSASLGEPKPCTPASRSPICSSAARYCARGAGPGVTASNTVPPLKSMPRFNPMTAKDAMEPTTASAERMAANGDRRTKLM